jgi:hypothetical protein
MANKALATRQKMHFYPTPAQQTGQQRKFVAPADKRAAATAPPKAAAPARKPKK